MNAFGGCLGRCGILLGCLGVRWDRWLLKGNTGKSHCIPGLPILDHIVDQVQEGRDGICRVGLVFDKELNVPFLSFLLSREAHALHMAHSSPFFEHKIPGLATHLVSEQVIALFDAVGRAPGRVST